MYKFLNELNKNFSNNKFFCLVIVFFIILLVSGTVIQKEIGLKSAQEIYFNSVIINKGLFIFPGGKLLISLIFLSLFIKIIKEIRNFNTFLIHLGFLIFFIFLFLFFDPNEEKYIIIEENEEKNFFVNNNLNSLYLSNDSNYESINFNKPFKKKFLLGKNEILIEVKKIFKNTNILINNKLDKKSYFLFNNIPGFVEKTHDKTCLNIKILDSNEKIIYDLFLIENIISKFEFKVHNNIFFIEFNKGIEFMPFKIKLIKFCKTDYLGTKSPKSFKSEIVIKDNNLNWNYVIEMNKPLRYKNFVFYQSSFIEDKNNSTILAISNNARVFYAYLAILISLVGFLFHMFNVLFKIGKFDG